MAVEKISYYEFFEYRLDLEKQQLFKNNEPVSLTHKAFQVLHLLVQNSGQITKKEDIFNQLWSDSFVEEANLTQHIYVLRRTLGRTPDDQSFIETIPRQGYRFTLRADQVSAVGKITSADSDETENENNSRQSQNEPNGGKYFSAPPLENRETASGDAGEADDSKDSSQISIARDDSSDENAESDANRLKKLPLRSLFFTILFLLAFALIAATAVYYLRQPMALLQPSVVPAAENTGRINSIAVLPFRPIGEEIDKEKLGLGMSDAVIAKLSNLRQITVRPTSAVFRYAERAPENAVLAGKELGVDSILEGTVQFDGERIRVSVQFVRVSDGTTLWADSFQENLSDIFTVQDSISQKVVATLSLNLNESQQQVLSRHPTTSPEAFQAYQMGVYFWNRRGKEDLRKAVEYFQKAVEIDPAYAQAYAALADAYSMIAYYRFADVGEMKENARSAAEKAFSLDDSLAEAHIALAMVYAIKKENFARAQELLERAVRLAPYSATARHRHAWILLMNGKLDEGVEEMRMARENDPLSPAANRAYCSVLIMQRNLAEAGKECERTFEIYQATPNSRRALARVFFHTGRHADALGQLEIQLKSGNEDEKFFARSSLAYFYAKLKRADEAEKIYAVLKKEYKRKKGFTGDPQQAGDLALIGFELGKKDEAAFYFTEMSKLLDEYADMTLSLYYDPYWDEMKNDPLFAPLFPKEPASPLVPPPPDGNSQTDAPGKIY